jgi:hypothetical protein
MLCISYFSFVFVYMFHVLALNEEHLHMLSLLLHRKYTNAIFFLRLRQFGGDICFNVCNGGVITVHQKRMPDYEVLEATEKNVRT